MELLIKHLLDRLNTCMKYVIEAYNYDNKVLFWLIVVVGEFLRGPNGRARYRRAVGLARHSVAWEPVQSAHCS